MFSAISVAYNSWETTSKNNRYVLRMYIGIPVLCGTGLRYHNSIYRVREVQLSNIEKGSVTYRLYHIDMYLRILSN